MNLMPPRYVEYVEALEASEAALLGSQKRMRAALEMIAGGGMHDPMKVAREALAEHGRGG